MQCTKLSRILVQLILTISGFLFVCLFVFFYNRLLRETLACPLLNDFKVIPLFKTVWPAIIKLNTEGFIMADLVVSVTKCQKNHQGQDLTIKTLFLRFR